MYVSPIQKWMSCYKSLNIITLILSIHKGPSVSIGIMKGIFSSFSRSLWEYFDGTSMCRTMPSTLHVAVNCITMETTTKRKGWWKKEWKMGKRELMRNTKWYREKAGYAREELMPEAAKWRQNGMNQNSGFDVRATSSVSKRCAHTQNPWGCAALKRLFRFDHKYCICSSWIRNAQRIIEFFGIL